MPPHRVRRKTGADLLLRQNSSLQERDSQGRYELAHLLLEDEADSAVRYLESAAQQNHAASLDLLGMLYATGEVVEKDPERAFGYFKQGAALGNTDAQYHLGMALNEGFGCTRNLTESFAWLRISARKDHPDAMFAFAVALEKGLGTEPDPAQAENLYEQAALLGSAGALNYQIKKITAESRPDTAQLLRWLHMACAADLPVGMIAVARQMLENSPADTSRAVSLLERSASLGDVSAMNELAVLWYDGRFVPRDWVQAIVYAHMASTAGSREARRYLEEWRSEADDEALMLSIEIASLANREEIIKKLRSRQSFGAAVR